MSNVDREACVRKSDIVDVSRRGRSGLSASTVDSERARMIKSLASRCPQGSSFCIQTLSIHVPLISIHPSICNGDYSARVPRHVNIVYNQN